MSDLLSRLVDGHTLTASDAEALVEKIVRAELSEVEIAAALTALRMRGETANELTGAARAMRRLMLPLGTTIPGSLDTAGTGGDGSGSFNISTATAIVLAGCEVPVAKHGNRSRSSASGSADVLQHLGFPLEAPPEVARKTLEEVGLAFFFAPQWHPAMASVVPIRKQLRFRTLFNLIGPLSNPAQAEFQVIGVGRLEWLQPMAEAICNLGTKGAIVVHGSDGLDEVTLAGTTDVAVVRAGTVERQRWSPADFGLGTIDARELVVASPAESAAKILGILRGERGPARDIVVANAAAALWTVRSTDSSANGSSNGSSSFSLTDGVRLAEEAIDRGSALRKLEDFLRLSQPD